MQGITSLYDETFVNGNGLGNGIEAAIHWLTRSGVQASSKEVSTNGGYAAWYDEEAQSLPYLMPKSPAIC